MEDRKELIKQLFRGEEPSRVPAGFWFHFLPDAETGDALKDPQMLEKNVAGHRRYIGENAPDMVKVMSDGFFLYPLESPVNCAADLAFAVKRIGPGHPWIAGQTELARRVAEIDGGECCFYNVFSPLTTLRFTLGLEKVLGLINESPEKLGSALWEAAEGLSVLAESVIARGGADGIYLSVQNPKAEIIGREMYQRLIAPPERAVLERAVRAGGLNILHICGYAGVRNDLSLYTDYPADAFNWAVSVEGTPLSAGRALFPGKVLIGGFPNTPGSVLHQGSRAEIAERTKEIIKGAGPRRLIVGADCTLPNDQSFERLRWAREAGRLGGP